MTASNQVIASIVYNWQDNGVSIMTLIRESSGVNLLYLPL